MYGTLNSRQCLTYDGDDDGEAHSENSAVAAASKRD